MITFKKYGLILIAFSGILVALFITVFLTWYEQQTVEAAARDARNYYTLNLHYRAWNASLGGVYASTDKVAPNPHLNVPQREVTLTDGRRLTLINPAYMTSLVFERISADPNQAIFNKLVSLKPLNPANAANSWETAALLKMEQTPTVEFSQLAAFEGKEYLQFLGPFVTEQSCLKCHEQQGYKVGDLRGAISISIPMAKFRTVQEGLQNRLVGGLLIIWGSFSIFWGWLSKRRYDNDQERQLSDERNRTIFETSQAGIFMVDPSGTVTVANRSMAEMFGYPLDELIGKKYPELVCPEERQSDDSRMLQLIRGEISSVLVERHYQRSNGSTFWGHLSGRRLEDERGRLLSLIGVIADITPIKQAVDEINQAKDYFFSILNTIADPVFVKDDQYRLVLVNDAACRQLGRDRSEILGKRDSDLFPAEQVEIFRRHDDLVLKTGDLQINQEELTAGGGQTLIVLSHKSCYIDQDGRRFIVGILRDITAQKVLEHQATRAAQLAAVGELAAGVAHEINNPIMGVINCAQLLLDRQSVREEDRPVLERVIKGGDRVAAIVRSLLFFSRDSGNELAVILIQDLLVDVLQLVSAQLCQEGVDLRLNQTEAPLRIRANPQQVEQVLLNLISNARHALQERHHQDLEQKTLLITIDDAITDSGPICRIVVRDNGTGIPKAVRERLGRPFVTTKPAGVGTGLGLSICQEIVKRFGGSLRIDSQEGEFTEVTVAFPVV